MNEGHLIRCPSTSHSAARRLLHEGLRLRLVIAILLARQPKPGMTTELPYGSNGCRGRAVDLGFRPSRRPRQTRELSNPAPESLWEALILLGIGSERLMRMTTTHLDVRGHSTGFSCKKKASPPRWAHLKLAVSYCIVPVVVVVVVTPMDSPETTSSTLRFC
jgi:hypothetical protein